MSYWTRMYYSIVKSNRFTNVTIWYKFFGGSRFSLFATTLFSLLMTSHCAHTCWVDVGAKQHSARSSHSTEVEGTGDAKINNKSFSVGSSSFLLQHQTYHAAPFNNTGKHFCHKFDILGQ